MGKIYKGSKFTIFMTIDTDIEKWESIGDIEFAIDEPQNIYMRGEPEALQKLYFAFYQGLFPNDAESHFEQSTAVTRGFKELKEAEAEKRATRGPEFELNLSNERFYLISKYDIYGVEVRPTSILRYYNKNGVFGNILKKFNEAMERYKAQ